MNVVQLELEINPSAIKPEDYEAVVLQTAYFMSLVPEDDRANYLSKRLNEEVDELFCADSDSEKDEKIRILWGRNLASKEREAELQSKMASELGDCLYYIAAGAMIKNISLSDLLTEATRFYCGNPEVNGPDRLGSFDAIMTNRIEPAVREDYAPDYFWMQRFGIEPYRQIADDTLLSGLQVTEDGYYALHNAMTYVSSFLCLNSERYKEAAVIGIGVISAVAQARLDCSLEQIAQKNMDKLLRRLQKGTLREGDDIEREKISESDRPDFSTWENTLALLIFAPIPHA